MEKPYRLLRAILLLFFLWWPVFPGLAQQRRPVDELFYPGVVPHQLHYPKGQQVYIQLSSQPLETVLLHYLRLARSSGWRLDFPSEMESQAWLRGLESSRASRVFMLNLYHRKTKVNYSLTIGETENTRDSRPQSIITIYGQQRPFGR